MRVLLVEGQRNTARLIGCFRNVLFFSCFFNAPKMNSTVGQRVHFHFSIYKVFTHYGMIYYIPLVRAVNDQNECEKNCCGYHGLIHTTNPLERAHRPGTVASL